jgi:hypothetical protein
MVGVTIPARGYSSFRATNKTKQFQAVAALGRLDHWPIRPERRATAINLSGEPSRNFL